MNEKMINQIDRLAEIKTEMETLKSEKEQLEAEIIKQGAKDLENTKFKSVYYAAASAGVRATNAETLKITYPSFLPFVFDKAYGDAVKENKTYKLSAPATRMIVGLWKGDFIKADINDVINSMPVDYNSKEQLIRKIKGINYDKDVQNILKFTNLTDDDAREYAYMAAEAAVWQDFCNLLTLNGITTDNEIDDILNKIRSAFVVEDTTKIQLEEY